MKVDPKALNSKKAHDILTDIVTPRPIAFVSTIGGDGVYNVAPYSFVLSMFTKVSFFLPFFFLPRENPRTMGRCDMAVKYE